jgi:hypothetical protein
MDWNKDVLIRYLSVVLKDEPDISERAFNERQDKPCSERVYRRIWGTFKKAKHEAGKLLPDPSTFDFKKERSEKLIIELRKEIINLKKTRLTTEEIRSYIFKLRDVPVEIPNWTTGAVGPHSGHGIPTLLLSDWHIGETVKTEQVFDVNKFDLEVAGERVQTLADNTIDILTQHLKSDYPGLVLLLNGDFVSGCIHDELIATNEEPIMPIILKTYGMLIWFIEQMMMYFPKLMIFCAPGNHARTTKKPVFKDIGATSYDWLIYNLLESYFEDSPDVCFNITPSDDLQYKVYNHGYRMTHGGQFRGGQGFLGYIAPVTRGEIRKRSAAESYGQNYDTLVIGHFHSFGMFKKVIVNGSLIGYNEYAIGNNLPYERPMQALWLTHPVHGITFSCPIFCSQTKIPEQQPWVSFRE